MSDKSCTSKGNEAVAAISNNTQAASQQQNAAGQQQQQAQVPAMWNYHHMYNMYGMYNMNMYQNYNHPYYQMLASTGGYGGNTAQYQQQQQQQQQSGNNQQMLAMEAYRNSFTSGGTLASFTGVHQASPATTTSVADSKTQAKTATAGGSSAAGITKVEEIELPPLPPGPPPPSVPPPPPPAPSPPPPLPPTDPATSQQSTPATSAVPTVISPYPQYIGFNMSNQQMYQQHSTNYHQQNQYQKSQHKQYSQNQQQGQYGQNQQQNQYAQNQQQSQYGQNQQQNQYGQNQQSQYGQTQQPNQFNQSPQQSQFNQSSQQSQFNQTQQQNQFNQTQQQNQYNQNAQQQNQYGQGQKQIQYSQNQYLYPPPGGQQQSGGVGSQQQGQGYGQAAVVGAGTGRWDSAGASGGVVGKQEKETRWSQPAGQPPIRFTQPNNNRNNRFNNQQPDGPIRFNMNRPRGRLNANKGPLLPNPEWGGGGGGGGVAAKGKWNQGKGPHQQQTQQQQPATVVKDKPALSTQDKVPSLSDEETLRKLVDGWPDNLKEYVDRCFSECPPEKKDKLIVVLKSQLIKAANNGSLWCKMWQFEPIPMLEDEEDEVPKKIQTRLEARLGFSMDSQAKSPTSKKKKKDRRSRGRSSSSSGSSHSSQEGYIGFSAPSSSKKKSKNKEKKKNKYKHNLDESHYWSEFGLMNGGQVETKKEVLDKRAARFNTDKGGGGSNKPQAKSKPPAQGRFGQGGSGGGGGGRFGHNQGAGGHSSPYRPPLTVDSFAMDIDTDFDLSTCHIVGTCRDIEKPYLRLTTAPEPSQVRPPEVLRESLDFVKEKWVEGKDYRYICEQLKSIRQDLTVQGIRDAFTVLVYEAHAKIALETGDHAEFNQCQSQLSILHPELDSPNRHEFTAYRLLYFIFTQDFMDVNTMLMSLTVEEKRNTCIEHAVSVLKAWLSSNFDRLLKLYSTCPRMSSYLMDWFIARERRNALKVIIKAYRPSIPTDLLVKSLAFENETKLMDFLEPLGLIYTDPSRKTIDCKQSTTALQA